MRSTLAGVAGIRHFWRGAPAAPLRETFLPYPEQVDAVRQNKKTVCCHSPEISFRVAPATHSRRKCGGGCTNLCVVPASEPGPIRRKIHERGRARWLSLSRVAPTG